MEKMMWAKPELNEVAFAANEYVAACGDQYRSYMFDCSAGLGQLYYYKDLKVTDENQQEENRPVWGNYTATHLGTYISCPAKHSTESAKDFFYGFLDPLIGGNMAHDTENYWGGETVIVYLEYNDSGEISNWHATKELDMDAWETAKS